MSARVWTREELDRVHPLPEGWAWELHEANGVPTWNAVYMGDYDEENDACCFIWPNGVLCTEDNVPADVALAVILASKGLDSAEEMARALDFNAQEAREAANGQRSSVRRRCTAAAEYSEAIATMLRRGTVKS